MLPLNASLAGAAAALSLLAAWLVLYLGSPVISVKGGMLEVGRARIPVAMLGEASALTPERKKALLSSEADARAFLCLQSTVKTALYLKVNDPNDQTPYWIVSTRRPDQLAEAIAEQ